jgi:hypothetical protein
MLSVKEAIEVVHKNHPLGEIQSWVTYKNLYLFQVFNKRPGEEEMDPFFSVDKETGEFKEFSILTDGNTAEVVSLFERTRG